MGKRMPEFSAKMDIFFGGTMATTGCAWTTNTFKCKTIATAMPLA
jgi:hypothetical protein